MLAQVGAVMGIAVYLWAWAICMSPSTKLVLLCLAEHSDDHGNCWPSLQRIVDMTGLGRSTVTRCLFDLEASGLVDRKRGKGGRGHPTRYRLAVGKDAKQSHDGNVEQSQGETVSVRNSSTASVKQSQSEPKQSHSGTRTIKNRKGTIKEGKQRPCFTPPTVDEVHAYCQERRNSVDPQQWHDYYTANGWKVGKNPMNDWQASVRTWERRSGDRSPEREYGAGAI